MADPNRHVHGHHDPAQTPENIYNESLDIDFEFPDDPPSGENIMLDEDVTQLVRDRGNTMLNEDTNQFGHGTWQAAPSGGANDQSNYQHSSGNFNPEFSNFGNPTPLLQWPAPAEPYTCSCCQVLREIIHTIDGESRKFEIHGRVGEIFHGILEIRRGDADAPITEYQMFNFREETMPDIKAFLFQYCEERTDAGYTLVVDPLLAFHEALRIGSDWEFGVDGNEYLDGYPRHPDEDPGQPPPDEPDDSQPQAPRNKKGSKGKGKLVVNEAGKKVSKKAKTKGKGVDREQRVSTEQLQVQDFAVHLNLSDAAEKFQISATKLKSICKEAGFSWPSKEIKNYEKQIAKKREILNSSANVEERRVLRPR